MHAEEDVMFLERHELFCNAFRALDRSNAAATQQHRQNYSPSRSFLSSLKEKDETLSIVVPLVETPSSNRVARRATTTGEPSLQHRVLTISPCYNRSTAHPAAQPSVFSFSEDSLAASRKKARTKVSSNDPLGPLKSSVDSPGNGKMMMLCAAAAIGAVGEMNKIKGERSRRAKAINPHIERFKRVNDDDYDSENSDFSNVRPIEAGVTIFYLWSDEQWYSAKVLSKYTIKGSKGSKKRTNVSRRMVDWWNVQFNVDRSKMAIKLAADNFGSLWSYTLPAPAKQVAGAKKEVKKEVKKVVSVKKEVKKQVKQVVSVKKVNKEVKQASCVKKEVKQSVARKRKRAVETKTLLKTGGQDRPSLPAQKVTVSSEQNFATQQHLCRDFLSQSQPTQQAQPPQQAHTPTMIAASKAMDQASEAKKQTGYYGVYRLENKGCYTVYCGYTGHFTFIGHFRAVKDAAEAYDRIASKLPYAEYLTLNNFGRACT